MNGKRIGYIRVSTIYQNPERQLESVQLDKKFIDYASAKSANRPSLKAMLEFVREDDIVIVHSMDRLSRTVKDLKALVDDLLDKKIKIHFMKENLQFNGDNSALANLMLHMMAAFAEFEYAFIRERQREGIAMAKKAGKYKGTKKKLTATQVNLIHEQISTTRKSKSRIAQEFGVARGTLYRYINRHKI